MRRYFLVDYENVPGGIVGINQLVKTDTVCIFYSEKSKQSLPMIDTKAAIESILVKTIGTGNTYASQALDFQLATYLGSIAVKRSNPQVYVVSRDTGFDFVCSFWKERGVSAERVTSILKVVDPTSESSGLHLPTDIKIAIATIRHLQSTVFKVVADKVLAYRIVEFLFAEQSDTILGTVNKHLAKTMHSNEKVQNTFSKLKPLLLKLQTEGVSLKKNVSTPNDDSLALYLEIYPLTNSPIMACMILDCIEQKIDRQEINLMLTRYLRDPEKMKSLHTALKPILATHCKKAKPKKSIENAEQLVQNAENEVGELVKNETVVEKKKRQPSKQKTKTQPEPKAKIAPRFTEPHTNIDELRNQIETITANSNFASQIAPQLLDAENWGDPVFEKFAKAMRIKLTNNPNLPHLYHQMQKAISDEFLAYLITCLADANISYSDIYGYVFSYKRSNSESGMAYQKVKNFLRQFFVKLEAK